MGLFSLKLAYMGQSPRDKGSCTIVPSSCRNPVLEIDCELLVCQSPVMHRHSPLLGYLADAHIDDLSDRIIGRKHSFGLGKFPNHAMVAFNRVCRIYYLPYFLRIFEKGSEFSPVSVPGLKNIRVLPVPLLAERLFCKLCIFKIHSTVYLLEIGTDSLPVLVRNELAAVPDLMDDTELILCFRENSAYSFA